GRHPDRGLPDPVRLPVPLGQRRAALRADDRPARPDPAVLGRLEEECPGSAVGELAVDPDGGLSVGDQPPDDGHDPTVTREHAEGVEVGPGPAVGEVRDRRPPGHGRTPVTAPRSPASKQVRSPVWQAAPTWSTRTSSASPSQSSATERTCWTWPEVAPLRQC